MLIKFWGTRGSLPVALTVEGVRRKLRGALLAAAGRTFADDAAVDAFLDGLDFAAAGTFGGASSCVEIDVGGEESNLCDAGSGLRAFGSDFLAKGGAARPRTFNIFLSHVHWDHIMGFPFFAPAYMPGNRIRLIGCHDVLEDAFRRQQSAPCFPVDFDDLSASIEFVRIEPDRTYEMGGMSVRAMRQNHSGDSFGYRFDRDGRSVVYSTDSEHKLEAAEDVEEFVRFFHRADLLIFDAMYSLADTVSVKEDWGHSSNIVGVELAHIAEVKHYCMFHHEPAYSDETIGRILDETIRFEELSRPPGRPRLRVSSAYDGLVIEL